MPGTRRQILQAWLAGAAAWAQPVGAQPAALRYIVPTPHDRFGHYVVALLARVAELTAQPYTFRALGDRRMTQRRLELEVGSPQGTVDLMWGMTSDARRRELRRLDVKLDQGLIGWRVLVVRRDDLARWPRQLPVAELQRRRAGQGLHWPDVDILRNNGYLVDTAADTATLYDMLRHGRLDYFPRSVMEVLDELAGLDTRDVAIVPDLALRYDTGNYIFIGPHQAAVAADLETALSRLQAQGELRKRFNAAFDAELRTLRLAQRRVIDLQAPPP
ncbi:hypothetical protein ACG01O_12825 [Roseateles sp. BYS87W]|uniref:Solute-binding protein family 3/N-terminal domain-containing protein n=1 Tax=Pelomonas baiyunensis TaxID=3299026 RepID=A0ABW7GZU5_9BURK